MFCVVETGGKQYKVSVGECFNVEKLNANVNDVVDLKVLMLQDGENLETGNPYLAKTANTDDTIITSDVDLEAELIPPAGDTCTVIFYDKHYMLDNVRNILKTETVTKGGTATPPVIEQEFIEGNHRYEFSHWSISYSNVQGNVLTYPVYNKFVIFKLKCYI